MTTARQSDWAPNDRLIRAIREGDAEGVERAIRSLIDLDSREEGAGLTALHIAVVERRPDFVCMLLRGGAQPDPVDDFQRTPLFMALLSGDVDSAKALLTHGADLGLLPPRTMEKAVLRNEKMVNLLSRRPE